MQKQQYKTNESPGMLPNLFSNTGYRRSYNKTDKVDSNYFVNELTGSKAEDNILLVKVSVPSDIEDIEKWLQSLVRKAGYRSLKELLVHISLPEKEAIVMQSDAVMAEPGKEQPIDIIRNIIILSRCNRVGYYPGSPMIFSNNRINRSVNLVSINLNSFYELD